MTATPATSLSLRAYSYFGGYAEVVFDENGWRLVSDTRRVTDGYLHVDDDSPEEVTPKVCESLIRYFFQHDVGQDPGLGATPQRKYLAGYSREQRETIGNNGKREIYNR